MNIVTKVAKVGGGEDGQKWWLQQRRTVTGKAIGEGV